MVLILTYLKAQIMVEFSAEIIRQKIFCDKITEINIAFRYAINHIIERETVRMKIKFRKLLRPILFIIGGAIVGLVYYYLVGCENGSCPLTSNLWLTMGCMGLVGGLLSAVFSKGGSETCNM